MCVLFIFQCSVLKFIWFVILSLLVLRVWRKFLRDLHTGVQDTELNLRRPWDSLGFRV